MSCAEQNVDPVLGKSWVAVLLSMEPRPCQPEGTADLKAGSQAVGIQPGCPLQDAVEERPPEWGSERSHPTGEARAAQGLEDWTTCEQVPHRRL